jgi:outer membrane receptor for ferric coprogen and ferric-rhodotorulic acid
VYDSPVHQNLDSVLQTVNLHANWNHPFGLFSRLEGNWYHQQNSGFSTAEPGDDFWQCNAFVGYRFWKRRAEFTVGLLNVFDQNYRLEPLNLYNEMARSRTFLARLKISF